MSDLYLEPKERAALLRKAAHAILEQPEEHFAMMDWVRGKVRKQEDALVFDCDSACCLAGETAALHPAVTALCAGAHGPVLVTTSERRIRFRLGFMEMGFDPSLYYPASIWNPGSLFWYKVTGTPQDDEHRDEWDDLIPLTDSTIRTHLLAGVERYITEQGWEKGEGDG